MVVKGIGIDLIEVERIRRAINRRPVGFRRRVFTPAEWSTATGVGRLTMLPWQPVLLPKRRFLRPWGAAGARSPGGK